MQSFRVILLAAALAVSSGCATQSISDPGYRDQYGNGIRNPMYEGELSAYDVLGGDVRSGVSDADIARVLDEKRSFALRPGAGLMLVQSGAPFPDSEMIAAMQKHYRVSSFTGVPWHDPSAANDTADTSIPYSQRFRLVAARGGFQTVIVYWGVLESGTENIATKAISWVPFVGANIPDEVKRMRIKLVAAIIDTRTGQWETYSPEPFEDTSFSNQLDRAASHDEQVLLLKAEGYQALADGLAAKYGG
jgi:hypothetical protein